jgi:2-oxoglutarate dehydrogenase E1 component
MGAWTFADPCLEWALGKIGTRIARAPHIGRSASASPAVGVVPLHMAQLALFLEEAFEA